MPHVTRRRIVVAGLAVAASAVLGTWAYVTVRDGTRHGLVVGGVEDAAKWGDPVANMERAQTAGFKVIVLSSVWTRGDTAPDGPEVARLKAAIDAAEHLGIRPIVAVYSFGRDTPRTRRARLDFGSYAAAILRAIPELSTISLGNEPNSNRFWWPQFG